MGNENHYQWDSEDYARHSRAQFQWARELIEKLQPQGSEAILDIGCGDGKVTAVLAESVPQGRVVGVDQSFNMVCMARKRYCLDGQHSNLAFCQMDAAHLGFAPTFDLVFSNAALHWVMDHPGVLEGVSLALKPGGRLLFQMGGEGNAADIIAAIDAVRARPQWKEYFQGFPFPYAFYSPRSYYTWLPKAWLEPIRAELIEKDMVHDGAEGLAGWGRTTWLPYLQQVPESQRSDFLQQIIDLYLQDFPPDFNDQVHVKMVRLEVEARKYP